MCMDSQGLPTAYPPRSDPEPARPFISFDLLSTHTPLPPFINRTWPPRCFHTHRLQPLIKLTWDPICFATRFATRFASRLGKFSTTQTWQHTLCQVFEYASLATPSTCTQPSDVSGRRGCALVHTYMHTYIHTHPSTHPGRQAFRQTERHTYIQSC